MTLRGRIYLLVALAVAPAFALLALDHQRSLQLRETEAEQQALQSAWLVSGELDQIFQGIAGMMRAAVQTAMVSDLLEPACSDYLARLERISPSAAWIVVLDARGTPRCGATDGRARAVGGDFLAEALQTDELVVGTYITGGVPDTAVLPLAVRMHDPDGPGLIVAGISLRWVREHFANQFAKLPPRSSLTIADRNATILVRLPNSDREGMRLQAYEFVVHAAQPGTFRSIAERNADGIARFLGYTPLSAPPRGVAIAIGFPADAVLIDVRAAARLNYLLMGLAAALAFLAAAIGGRAFIRQPMSELLATIERWRRQDVTARASHASERSEFDQLGKAFNSMADELEAALRHKDILLRELSHRVMNSLQTIGALFRLQSRSVQEPAARAHFEQAVARIDAMALVYRRMQSAQGVEAIEFGSLLAELCGALQSSMMTTQCIVRADPVLLTPQQAIPLSLIVNELLTNAIKHGASSGEPIVVELDSAPGRCHLSISNPGDLPADYMTKARGFGMTMITAMVTQLAGELAASSAGGRIAFTVTFAPATPQQTLKGPATTPPPPHAGAGTNALSQAGGRGAPDGPARSSG